MTFDEYWATLEEAGWFAAYEAERIETFRATLRCTWERDPSRTVFDHGLLAYDSGAAAQVQRSADLIWSVA